MIFAGCSSTRYIEDYQSIVKKVKIDSVDKNLEEEAANYIQKDIRPASGLGLNLKIYNLFNTKDGKYKTSHIKPLGSPPPILDSNLVDISRSQIERFLKTKGYFNAKVNSEIIVEKKKATLIFTAKQGPEFLINQFKTYIPDSAIKAIYEEYIKPRSAISIGMRYDEDSLVVERDRIHQVLRKNGYYDFVKPYIRFVQDSNQNNSRVAVNLFIDNPLDTNLKHRVYAIGESNMIIAPSSDGFTEEGLLDSLKIERRAFNGLRYLDLSKQFRRNPITRYDFLRQGEVYDVEKETLTYDRLYQLNVFKNVRIDYNKSKDSTQVEPVILLIPQKRMSNRIEGEIPFNDGTVGLTLSNTYTNNNFFNGAERFQFQVKGGLQSRRSEGKSIFSDIYQRDFSVSASLSVPRLMVPFVNLPMMGKNGMPFTTFSTSYQFTEQTDVMLRRIFTNSVSYDWIETRSKYHSLTPLNVEYRSGEILIDTLDKTNIDRYNANRELLINNSYNIKLLGRKDFTLGIKYAFTLNADKLLENKNFIYLRGNIDLAGNLLYALSSLGGQEQSPSIGQFGKVFGLPFNQYVRPELDVRLYRNLGGYNQFIARINAGLGYAYGNSNSMPFDKLFYAGGSSGVRAWQARTLGPGNYNRDVIASAIARNRAFGIDQLGQMRIEGNLEYRYLLINKFFGGRLKGAAFLDFGNTWNIAPGNPQPETYFKFNDLDKQIALGTGIGFRMDVDFFVFRFDLGLKVKDPQFRGGDQWVINKFFSGGKAFKERYGITNNPDVYNFLQYNFGIGFPF